MGATTAGEIQRSEHFPTGHPEDVAQRVPAGGAEHIEGSGFGLALAIFLGFVGLFGSIIAAGVWIARHF